MKKISENKKLKVLYYYDVGIPPFASAIALKMSEKCVKNILKENNRNGPPPPFTQAYNTWRYLDQQFGEPVLNNLSKNDKQQLQQLAEENSGQKEKITELTDALQKANDREQNQKQESEKKTEELKQQHKENDELKQRNTELTHEKEIDKQEKEKLQNQVNKQNERINDQYEYILKVERELGEQKNKVTKMENEKKTIQKEHHETVEKLTDGGITLINENKRLNEKNETYLQKIVQLENEVLSLTKKSKTSFGDGLAIGGLGVGVVAATIGIAVYQNSTSPP